MLLSTTLTARVIKMAQKKVNKLCVALSFMLLLSPACSFSQSPTLSGQILEEADKLEKIQQSFSEVESRLSLSEQSLADSEKSLAETKKTLQELSLNYAASQKKLRFWRISLPISVLLAFTTGFVVGAVCTK